MLEPLPITVVVPAYNSADFIRDALKSVHAQTRAPSQIIVVDDGSTDATASIARDCGADVIAQGNRGIAHARNVAIRAATTPWIALLDADDLWRADRLERQWALHERHPGPLLLASDYAYLFEGEAAGGSVFATMPQYRTMPRTPLGNGDSLVARRDVLHAIARANFLLPSSMLVARGLFAERDTFYLPRECLPDGADDFTIGEDYEWLLRALRHTDVLLVGQILVRYRRTTTSVSSSGGRFRYGDVKLGELVCASPEGYAAGAAAEFEGARTRALRETGLRHLRSGDIARARKTFALLLRHERNWQSLALHAATTPFATPRGRAAYGWLHALLRNCLRPALRALRRFAP